MVRRDWRLAMGVIKQIVVSAGDRAELERIVAARSSEVRLVERARIVLRRRRGARAQRSLVAWGVLSRRW
jgi:hypothetical protein